VGQADGKDGVLTQKKPEGEHGGKWGHDPDTSDPSREQGEEKTWDPGQAAPSLRPKL